ncbi:MAG: gamma-glutamyltransferase [Acidobacteria bacterium]|nr:gamma-glutamyltransferase [Acidobacteriota bacterium]
MRRSLLPRGAPRWRIAMRSGVVAVVLAAVTLLVPSSAPQARPASAAASGSRAVVVASEPLAAEVGIDILRSGGNVIDAAVAVGFALAVTYPRAGNLGGGGFLLYRRASDGASFFIDFRERAPRSANAALFRTKDGKPDLEKIQSGPLSVGVPGSPAGLCLAAKRFGSLPLEKLAAPAVRLARKGFPVSETLAESLARAWEWDTLNKDEGASNTFGRDGRPLQEGDLLRQPDLADILESIGRKGPDAFYKGDFAARLAGGLKKLGGIMDERDLAEYAAAERTPLKGKFRDVEIVTSPPPSAGGVMLLMMLNMLESAQLEQYGHNSSESIHLMAEAMRRAFADRSEYLGDPDFSEVPVQRLTDPAYAHERWADVSLERATPSSQIGPGIAALAEGPHTTHYSIMDAEGNAVSVTTTLNWGYGSGILIPGTGVLLNNEMDDFSLGPEAPNLYGLIGREANEVEPAKRMLSSMTPTLVLRDGKAWLVLGSPGGSRIPNAVLQVLLNRTVFDLPLREAVEAPRVHHQWKPDRLDLEKRGIPADVARNLEKRGHTLRPSPWWIGEVNVAELDAGMGRVLGVADPRRGGVVAVW